MEWEAVGAIGEILGAVAVVATLGYLALQVRYTRNAWQRQNERELLDGVTQSSRIMIEQPGLPDILLRAQENYADLSEEEKIRYHMWMYLWITKIDQALRDRDLGGFKDDEQLEISVEALATALRLPGSQTWWTSSKWLFTEATQSRIEEAIAAGSATSRSIVIEAGKGS
jgi:hypothetical protein